MLLLMRSLPRPKDLQRDCDFRRSFYAVWGKVSAVLDAQETDVQYMPYEQRLSIKACWGGEEQYFIDGRAVTVDDDNYLIFNDRRTYASVIRSVRPVRSFSIFFRPGFAEEVLGGMLTPQDRILDRSGDAERRSVEFAEHLRPHDRLVTPVLKYIAFHVAPGRRRRSVVRGAAELPAGTHARQPPADCAGHSIAVSEPSGQTSGAVSPAELGPRFHSQQLSASDHDRRHGAVPRACRSTTSSACSMLSKA